MSAPKIIVQILITGTQIFGKALYAAGAQAIKNAKTAPQALGGDVAGVNNATSGSLTDKLTREHRLTLSEAHSILHSKPADSLESVLERYQHLFKANSPPEGTNASGAGSRKQPLTYHSHYLQSKVVRARERIEAELRLQEGSTTPSPPPPSPSDPTHSSTSP